MNLIRALGPVMAAALLSAGLTLPADAAPPPGPDAPEPSAASSSVAPSERDRVLAADWRTSPDLAWTTDGDASGFHVLVAEERTGYAWRTLATLSEPGFDTDRWIGNVCFTASGGKAVAVYAPRAFTNQAALFDRGAFTALIDVPTGKVTKLPVRSTLAYFNPGCGQGERSVLTQAKGGAEPGGGPARTRLSVLDAASGRLAAPVERPGQVTSAVPVRGGIVAATGSSLQLLPARGEPRELAAAASVPFRLAADGAGGVVFMEHQGDVARVRRVPVAGGAAAELASGPLTGVDVSPGTGGRVFLTGRLTPARPLPASVTRVDVPAGSRLSTHGRLAVLPQQRPSMGGGAEPSQEWVRSMTSQRPGEPQVVTLSTRITATGRDAAFTVGVTDGEPATASRTVAAAASSSTGTVDTGAYCSVPRNDPRTQVYQPTPRQVEWAADQAVVGNLAMLRPDDWKRSGLSQWRPQGEFPPLPLAGGGRVPVQVFLGIMSQETNLWQATGHVLPGSTGNPLVGNYYGRELYNDDPADDWVIDWDRSDCGYGITQITDGMRKQGHERPCKPDENFCEVALPSWQQREIAVDYATNISAGLRILQDKWNQTRNAGLIHSDGDPKWLENWIFAIWAYNSGFHPDQHDGSPWGVGWANNPANPVYPANRHFFNINPHDPAEPQLWPYQEKVIGFAAYSISTPDGPGFRPAWWISDQDRDAAKPPVMTFCDPGKNDCDYGDKAAPCKHKDASGQYDLKCWWHTPTWYRFCGNGVCGHELLRFGTSYPEQPDGTHYAPDCSLDGFPSGTVIVDDVPSSVPIVRAGCTRTWGDQGSFTLYFNEVDPGPYVSRVDFHQLGGGFGDHLWFTHTHDATDPGQLRFGVTGIWRPPGSVTGWTRIKVHIPERGAHTQLADYVIDPGGGAPTQHRIVGQHWQKNIWVDLGVFQLGSGANVSLSNLTRRGEGREWDWDIAFDAMAFVPTGKPKVDYVALGDSYSAGQGNEPYDEVSNFTLGTRGSTCHRSKADAYARLVRWPGSAATIENEARAGAGTTSFALLACSGAQTKHVTGDAYANGEPPQIDQGYLNAGTDLVTMTIGGNDVGFSDIINRCTTTLDCRDPSTEQAITGVEGTLAGTYEKIHQQAPNARIIVLGYPHLFDPQKEAPLTCLSSVRIGQLDALWLNEMTDKMNGVIAAAVARARQQGAAISFVDPVPAFTGHAICDDDPYVRAVDVTTDGASYHPNPEGQRAYAALVQSELDG
ncbi:GDSL-type esterase/lipase family protein [Actinomadura sp. ATCC 31491]|uniref:GDSL-type esterase/lipase family protein n=1 Tax=Actinomadura luzonensis TaxID=2805427 RepID=A0ABT0FSV2_9ACTN|nr:GDSL-type esterase/lipase family protein [Actinomadura luzonensis]MCK2215238.1 GDSL-type esterase/lipase family protein [Actinomadura luzonensis]